MSNVLEYWLLLNENVQLFSYIVSSLLSTKENNFLLKIFKVYENFFI